jgi:hypothetical protein
MSILFLGGERFGGEDASVLEEMGHEHRSVTLDIYREADMCNAKRKGETCKYQTDEDVRLWSDGS